MSRRSFSVATAVWLMWSLNGCVDGPNSGATPAPWNPGWNDGRPQLADGGTEVPAGTATNAIAPFDQPGDASSTGDEPCTSAQSAAINQMLNTAPIVLPNQAAELNLAGEFADGDSSWQGMTIEQAEEIDCTGTPRPDILGNDAGLSMAWNAGSVVVEYAIDTQQLEYIGLGPGVGGNAYLGTLTASSPDGNTTFVIAVDGATPVTAATRGALGEITVSAVTLDWLDASNGVPGVIEIFDQLYRAIMATFMPTFPVEAAGATCNQTGLCVIGTFPASRQAYFAVPSLGWAMWVSSYDVPALANAVDRMNLFFSRTMNYSGASPILKLDNRGPVTIPFVSNRWSCALGLGLSYADFFGHCVATAPSAEANASERRELLSSLSHDDETISFNIAGVDIAFSAIERLQPTEVVVDAPASGCADSIGNLAEVGCPQWTDTAFRFDVDQSTFGLIANDWQYDAKGNATYHDLAGAGALYDDFRLLSIQRLRTEICNSQPASPNCTIWFPGAADGGSATPASAIAGCIGARDASGSLEPSAVQAAKTFAACSTIGTGCGLPAGCTGMEPLLSADIPTTAGEPDYDDPVNIGPIVTQIDPSYSLGMKPGHQHGVWCYDAMTVNQIAAQSYSYACPGGASTCPANANAQDFQCPPGTCDPTSAECTGMPTCTATPGTPTAIAVSQGGQPALTPAQINLVGEVGTNSFSQHPDPVNPSAGPLVPGANVLLALPQACVFGDLLPQSHVQVVNTLGRGDMAAMPIDVQDDRFFFMQYGYSLIQTLEASTGSVSGEGSNGRISMPVSQWGPPVAGSNMPVQPNDLLFAISPAGQSDSMEYVDRRFVCPDGANDCAPPGTSGFVCPGNTCDVSVDKCPAPSTPLCNPNETSQPPIAITFSADVEDGVMNSYVFSQYLYRGETALYAAIQDPGYALAQESNAQLSSVFGSPLLTAMIQSGTDPFPATDLMGAQLNASDYAGAINYAATGAGTPLTLAYGQSPAQTLQIEQTFPESQHVMLGYAARQWPGLGGATSWAELLPWAPALPLNGFDVGDDGNEALDYFVETASVDFGGVTTSAVYDYDVYTGNGPDANPDDSGAQLALEALAVESAAFFGDIFLCYEASAAPPLLAVRMYTPASAVLDWLDSVPSSYSDCGIVVRWNPYDNQVSLIESTTYGVRLQVSQGVGISRIAGAQVYVPGIAPSGAAR